MIPHDLTEVCDPRSTAFIIYDMQAGVVSQVSNGSEIVSAVRSLLDAARASEYRVFFTRHQWLPNRYAGVAQLRRSMIWQQKDDPDETHPLFEVASNDWQIVPELAPLKDEVIIDKITMSCFAGTFLDIALRDAGIRSFIIAGIALEVGIEPTIRHALDLNYIPVVVSDACGYGNVDARDRSLATLAYTGEVFTADTDKVSTLLRTSRALIP